MKIITPPALKNGDTIGIVAPARKIAEEELEASVKMFESWGVRVRLGKNLLGEYHQFSGTDAQRAADFQGMINDAEVKAIVCARGGYGSVRLLDRIDFTPLLQNPKWVVGYSDITVFHSVLSAKLGIESIHGIMPVNFPKDGYSNLSTESLRSVLFGQSPNYRADAHPLNRQGVGIGQVIGGNLSMLYSLSGTDADICTKGKVLVLEDLDEYLYHVDRMMMNLKRGGKLKDLAGLMVGGMTEMNDNTVPYGKTAEEIIREAVEEYDYPVCFGFPVGHQEVNVALIMNRKAELSVGAHEITLRFLPQGNH